VAGYEAINLLGLIGPAGMPAPVIERLSAAMKKVLIRAANLKLE
jgi:tripartite-type tricarboxylate transporter receptor subunit TctC